MCHDFKIGSEFTHSSIRPRFSCVSASLARCAGARTHSCGGGGGAQKHMMVYGVVLLLLLLRGGACSVCLNERVGSSTCRAFFFGGDLTCVRWPCRGGSR